MFLAQFWQLLVQYHFHFHRLLKYVHFFWNLFCPHKLLDFVDQYFFRMFLILFFTQFKVSELFWITFTYIYPRIKNCSLHYASTHLLECQQGGCWEYFYAYSDVKFLEFQGSRSLSEIYILSNHWINSPRWTYSLCSLLRVVSWIGMEPCSVLLFSRLAFCHH